MIKHAMLAISFSIVLASAGSAASLSPALLKQSANSDLIQVKSRGHHGHRGHAHHRHYNAHRNYNHHRHYNRHYNYNRHHHYRGRYWYGGRSWGRRYYYRPYYWQTWGCIRVGPVWYCP